MRPALVFEDLTLSYAELDGRANRLARHLIGLGLGPEDIVGLLLDRSPELIIAMLAVLKSGAGYLPLDPDYPGARLGFMVGDSGGALPAEQSAHAGSLVVADGAVLPQTLCLDDADLAARLQAYPGGPVSDGERVAPLQPDHLAYLIYTSGSTGTPKGVGIPHRNVIPNLLSNSWALAFTNPCSSGFGFPR